MTIDLQNADLTALVRQRLGIRGGVTMALDETIAPVAVVLELDRAPWRINGYRFWGMGITAAVAAQFGNCQCGIPSPSPGIIGVIDEIVITNPTAAVHFYNIALTNGLQGFFRADPISAPELGDAVLPNPGTPVRIGGSTTAAAILAAGTIWRQQYVPITSTVSIPVEIAIKPGTVLLVEDGIVNSSVVVHFGGRVWASS